MVERVEVGGLKVAKPLYQFVNQAAKGTGVAPKDFWAGFADIVHDLAPKNRALLKTRDEIQSRIDQWHRDHKGPVDQGAYKKFLKKIGYIVPEGEAFKISTRNVDPEIAKIAGPQLVVPVMNARYALNAANARWGSLYDALYGTDAIPETDGAEKGKGYNPKRGAKVIAWARKFLDESTPLKGASWTEAKSFAVKDGKLAVTLLDGKLTGLASAKHFAGYLGKKGAPDAIMLRQNGLGLEAALTTIQDCEDSVAAVDAEDKVGVYSQLARPDEGRPEGRGHQGGKTFTRKLNPDIKYNAPDGSKFEVVGRSLMLVRNVGHLMTNPAVLDKDGNEVPEGIMDAAIDRADRAARYRAERAARTRAPARSISSSRRCTARRKSRFAVRTVRPRREALGLPAKHDQDRHHGRGAPHHGQPQGVHPRREGRISSSTPASSTAPATRCTRRWKPAR
jgi:malate synthase